MVLFSDNFVLIYLNMYLSLVLLSAFWETVGSPPIEPETTVFMNEAVCVCVYLFRFTSHDPQEMLSWIDVFGLVYRHMLGVE